MMGPVDHCNPTSPYLVAFSSAFNVCVPTNLAFLSTALGICSIISWLFAQAPQVYKNYKLQAASGLSIYFLIEWLLGDLTNLLGALLTGQAAWQVLVAVYYVTVDVCLVVQYIWYRPVTVGVQLVVDGGPKQYGYRDDGDGYDGNADEILDGIAPDSSIDSTRSLPLHSGPTLKSTAKTKTDAPAASRDLSDHAKQARVQSHAAEAGIHERPHSSPHRRKPNHPYVTRPTQRLFTAAIVSVVAVNAAPYPSFIILSSTTTTASSPQASSAETIGRILSWISTLLYLGSRLPQIYKNAHRRSTSGLSPSLFIAAFFGNLFYSTSLIANPLAWHSYPAYGLSGWVGSEPSDQITWLKLAAPFWLGAAGVLVMDAVIGLQFLWYGEKVDETGQGELVVAAVGEGRGRLRRVSGWMRGWVPSVSVRGQAARGEVRPLLVKRAGSGRGSEDQGEGEGHRGQTGSYGAV